jgi:hypothetical protein
MGVIGILQIFNSKSSFKRISCTCLTFSARSARVLAYFFPPLQCQVPISVLALGVAIGIKKQRSGVRYQSIEERRSFRR